MLVKKRGFSSLSRKSLKSMTTSADRFLSRAPVRAVSSTAPSTSTTVPLNS